MSDDKHKSELIETITDQIEIIDKLPLHPKNKLKLYQRWTLSKVSWHLTVTKISNTWMKNKIDPIVSRYIRLWLEIPVNGTLNIVTQSKRKFGLGVILSSTRHIQSQMTFRNKLRKSSNHNIREIYKSTRNINIQYDQFNSTHEALRHNRSADLSWIMEKLATQSLVVKSIWEFVDGRFINQWSNVISHLPRNIFSFTIRYLNNTLANGTYAIKQGITNSSTCLFCNQQQILGHVIGGCKTALLELIDTVLPNIYKIIKSQGLQVFVDIEGYPNPSLITGDGRRPDFAIVKSDDLLLLELTVGFKTNIKKNFDTKSKRY